MKESWLQWKYQKFVVGDSLVRERPGRPKTWSEVTHHCQNFPRFIFEENVTVVTIEKRDKINYF